MDPVSLTLVVCPECGATAEIEWRSTEYSTRGPVVLVKIRCLNRHWFLLPFEGLATASLTQPSDERLVRRFGP